MTTVQQHIPILHSLALRVDGAVARVSINRPGQANALDLRFWDELPLVLSYIAQQPSLRVVVLAGEGKHFCAGIDLSLLEQLMAQVDGSAFGRDRLATRIRELQASITAIEQCPLPVIAAVQGVCIGGGVDLIAACDIRHCTADARFCIKEIDFGIVADVGTSQRLQHVIGLPALMELSLTAETFSADKALRLGLVSAVHEDRAQLESDVAALAARIAAKPPITAAGVKRSLLFARDHSVAEGLEQAAVWNAGYAFAEETRAAIDALKQRSAKA